MVFPRPPASMLLASFILLLYWTTISAQSHALHSAERLPPSFRVTRELPDGTADQVKACVESANTILSAITQGLEKSSEHLETVASLMKSLSNIVGYVPLIGDLVSAVINVAMAFVPQENILNEMRKGFAEVNKKLDSLSMQISNLTTDVEWFNYASVYSQDEVRILNSWKKFNKFRDNSDLAQSQEEKLRLAEIFTNYYENTATESSVANLYHYLTVNDTSLSGNLNELLKKKFKCGTLEMLKYNLYFSSLLWKGMVLNQLYWRLIGFNPSNKEARHIQMFSTVYKAQISAVNFCLDNYKDYLKEDVMEISNKYGPDKEAVANQVKNKLDKKYNWYNWVVLVYVTSEESNYRFANMEKFPDTQNQITIALGYTEKGGDENKRQVQSSVWYCARDVGIAEGAASPIYENVPCNKVVEGIQRCDRMVSGVPVGKLAKVMATTYEKNFVQVPEALQNIFCTWGNSLSHISIYYSRSIPPCDTNPCENNGVCRRVLESNLHLCERPNGWRGNRCEKKMDPSDIPATDIDQPVPDITTINTKLKLMEAKLEAKLEKMEAKLEAKLELMEAKLQEILSSIRKTCPAQ